MPSFASVAAVALMATGALTSPTPQDATPNINLAPFRINQASRGAVLKNGPLQVAKAFAKFNPGTPIPSNVDTAAAKAQQSGTVSATPEQYDVEYLCPVQIGSPPQTLMMDFDTGSSDLWVYSSRLPAGEQTGHSVYQPGKSTSSQAKSGQSWSISYGDGSGASGVVYADTVAIGAVTATGQAVEAATQLSASFLADTNNDGLVGLGWPRINSCSPGRCQPFVQNVKSTLPKKVFTADLKAGAPGSFDFGFIDSSKYTGDITYTPVQKGRGYWEFTAGGYVINGTATSNNLDIIADTGTSLVYLPDKAVNAYYKQVSGSQNSYPQGGWIFPCNTSLPSLGITVKGTTFTIPGAYLSYAPIEPGSATCFGGLQSSSSLGINILGDVFLKSVFAVFDVANTRVGFATKNL